MCVYLTYTYIYTYAQWDQGKKAFFARRVNVEEEKPSAAAVLVLMCFLTTFYRTYPDFFCLIVSQKYHAFVWQWFFETTCVNHVWPVGKNTSSRTLDVCVVYVIGRYRLIRPSLKKTPQKVYTKSMSRLSPQNNEQQNQKWDSRDLVFSIRNALHPVVFQWDSLGLVWETLWIHWFPIGLPLVFHWSSMGLPWVFH